VDTKTGKRTSLQTGSKDEARQIVEARNQAERQPFINLQIAHAYLMAKRSSDFNKNVAKCDGGNS